MSDFYKSYFLRYIAADRAEKQNTKKHWTKCHAENMKSGRDDLIIFSAKILAAITLADEMLTEKTISQN